MQDLKTKYKLILLIGALVFLFIPVLQNTLHLKKWIKPLKGAYTTAQDTVLTKENWFNGRYQETKDKYVNENFGLRNYYVRLNNQIDYKFFRKANVEKVVIGKGDFLYESNYIEAYFGKNCIGKEKLTEHFRKVKQLQDLLSSQGILLEVVFAPGKATFYPEFIPDSWMLTKEKNNYEYSTEICRELKIDFIDFNAWFLKNKNIIPYDLYPKTGIHWSNYGALLATDSLKKDIEAKTHSNLRDIIITNIAFSDSLRDPDKDIGDAMNLLREIKPFPMPYANYIWGDEGDPVKPKALFIGDSYFWNIYYEGLTNNLFTDCKFWYYNQTVYPESEPERDVKKLNLAEEIRKNSVIVLLATDCHIQDIGWGFVDAALAALSSGGSSAREKVYVQEIIQNIRKNKQWLADIEKKAKSNNVTTDEMIKLDAAYVYKTDYCTPEVMKLTEQNKKRILNTKEWAAQLNAKAAERNISYEEMLELDAKYIYETEQKGK
jgi:hypothetical protein